MLIFYFIADDLLVTISEPILIRGMIGNLSIAKSHMSFILANLSSLQVFVLQVKHSKIIKQKILFYSNFKLIKRT